MLIALNCGIPGMSTIHANTARAALMKLTTLPLLAGENVTAAFVVPTVANAIDLVVQLRGTWQGSRAVSEIVALDRSVENGQIGGVSLYRPNPADLENLTGIASSTPDDASAVPRNIAWTAQSATFDFEAAFGSRARYLSTLVEPQDA